MVAWSEIATLDRMHKIEQRSLHEPREEGRERCQREDQPLTEILDDGGLCAGPPYAKAVRPGAARR